VCGILLKRGIIERGDAQEEYRLSALLGQIASNLRETHPIPLAELILKTDWFSGWTAKQMVGLLSTFVDIRVPSEQKAVGPSAEDARVLAAMTELQEQYDVLRREETDAQVWTGIDYEGALCFDMADTLMEWCSLTDELACKQFLTDLNAVGVSTGDFTKACMKVSAITKEMASMCESFPGLVEAIGFMRLLADVDGLIMKSVATTQSLYL
jgi:hypothetical protein